MEEKNFIPNKYVERALNLSGLWKVLILVIVVVIPSIAFMWITDRLFIFNLVKAYINDIAATFNINTYLSSAITIIAFLIAMYFIGKAGLSKSSRTIAAGGIVALLLAYYFLMAYGTDPHIFDAKGNPIKCYVITREGDVRFLEPIKMDPVTGLECRTPTPEVVERLKEYQLGKRPQRLGDEETAFFESRTSLPIVWYSKSKSGGIEIFNLMGFHPETGEELLPITREIVDQIKDQRRRHRPPRKIDPDTYAFFDSVSGDPRAWYWRDGDGDYEFYDNSGFHPRTGEQLKLVDRNVHTNWIRARKDAQAQEAAIQAAREREINAQIARERDAQVEQSQKQQQTAQAGTECDQLAANPSDPRRSSDVAGVRYEVLRDQTAEAIQACLVAFNQHPDEPRYKYQYARALSVNDPDKAIPYYQQLIRESYVAAYDNLGNIYLRKRDLKAAISVLKSGVTANDPDSMVTLAGLIERGHLPVQNPAAAKYALLDQAAKLGHSGAQAAIEQQKIELQQRQNERAFQQQEQQMMLDIFGKILRGVAR